METLLVQIKIAPANIAGAKKNGVEGPTPFVVSNDATKI
jgi:hypothetical protein